MSNYFATLIKMFTFAVDICLVKTDWNIKAVY